MRRLSEVSAAVLLAVQLALAQNALAAGGAPDIDPQPLDPRHSGQFAKLAGGLMTVGLIAAALGFLISLGGMALAGHSHNVHLDRFHTGASLTLIGTVGFGAANRLLDVGVGDRRGVLMGRRTLRIAVPLIATAVLLVAAPAAAANPVGDLWDWGTGLLGDAAGGVAAGGIRALTSWVADGAAWLVSQCFEALATTSDPRPGEAWFEETYRADDRGRCRACRLPDARPPPGAPAAGRTHARARVLAAVPGSVLLTRAAVAVRAHAARCDRPDEPLADPRERRRHRRVRVEDGGRLSRPRRARARSSCSCLRRRGDLRSRPLDRAARARGTRLHAARVLPADGRADDLARFGGRHPPPDPPPRRGDPVEGRDRRRRRDGRGGGAGVGHRRPL